LSRIKENGVELSSVDECQDIDHEHTGSNGTVSK